MTGKAIGYARRGAGWLLLLASAVALWAARASAHVSEQGFVLLLPTGVYIRAGVASVALTVILLALLPGRAAHAVFAPLRLAAWSRGRLRVLTSCLSAAGLMWLVSVGLGGPRDPLANPLPLAVWTLWWIGFVSLQGVLGNLWAWVGPWAGPLAVMRALGWRALLHLPHRAAPWVAVAGFLGFAAFLLADIAPADPTRLGWFVLVYWLSTLCLALLFGRRWLIRAEPLSVLMRAYGRMGLFGRQRGAVRIGVPGWQLYAARAPSAGLAVFMLVALGSGSFDGLNETFWWLGLIGINPLEFPGRSAIVTPTLLGLVCANVALIAAFWATVAAGNALAGRPVTAGAAFRAFAPSILPIALAYHVAHYLTTFLVDAQYALIAASDPYGTGADLLGLGQVYVTTGFFNTADSVRVIWLSQAGTVVLGHILAIVLAHGIAMRLCGTTRRAVLSQLPVAVFMVAYTFFGLWLLASPRGA